MMYIKARLLEVKELPEREPYPRSFLVSLLDGAEPITLVATQEAASALWGLEELEEVTLEASARQVDLKQLGGKGKAYRLRIERLVDEAGADE